MPETNVFYIHLPSGSEPPRIEPKPCRMLVVIEDDVVPEWQSRVSDWIVDSGCLFMTAWGNDCSSWDDSVDVANLEDFDYGDIPDDNFVMTTWHDKEPLEDALWFARFAAHHPTIKLPTVFIVHITLTPKEEEMLAAYWREPAYEESCQTPSVWHGLIERLKLWRT